MKGVESAGRTSLHIRRVSSSKPWRAGSGSGLGLAITKSLVALLNGTITVHSEVGHGTRFEVILPKTLKESGEG